MNSSLRTWLDEFIDVQGMYTRPRRCPRIEYIAELIGVNGHRLGVGGWGCIASGGIYGRHGLDQNEAHELMHYDGMFHAIFIIDRASADAIKREIEVIWDKRKRDMAIEMAALAQGDSPT